MSGIPRPLARPTQTTSGRSSGVVPFGYVREFRTREDRHVLVRHPQEGSVIAGIFSGYLRHKSLAKLVRSLGEQGVRTRGGRPWSRAAVAFVLSNRTYLGHLKFGDACMRGTHPPLVAPIVFHKVQQLKRRNAKRAARGAGPPRSG